MGYVERTLVEGEQVLARGRLASESPSTSHLGQSLQIVARRKPLYVCNAPTKFCGAAKCRDGPGH